MQVERETGFGLEYSGERVSNTWATCLKDWDNSGKPELIPGDVVWRKPADQMVASASALRWARVLSASW